MLILYGWRKWSNCKSNMAQNGDQRPLLMAGLVPTLQHARGVRIHMLGSPSKETHFHEREASLVGAPVPAGAAPGVAVREGLPVHALRPAVCAPRMPHHRHPLALAPLARKSEGPTRLGLGGLTLYSAAGGFPLAGAACQAYRFAELYFAHNPHTRKVVPAVLCIEGMRVRGFTAIKGFFCESRILAGQAG